MDDIKEKIKQALRHIWTNKYRLFLCLLTLCCLFGLIHYFKSADSATASISFNYSEAALGMNPNKTRFNAYEIVSDEVMERAIRRVGLQDSLTASQLAECLYLSPDGTGSANGSEYISTNYYLSINTRKLNLGNRKPTDLLQSVCESYREIFLSNYCDNQSILKEKLEVTTACEPYLRLNELEVRAAALNRYLNARLGENKSFTDEANPDPSTNNFTTLGKMINNLVDYDLPNAMAFVIEGGVARDPAMLTSILEYKNKIDDIDMRTQQAYYDADKKGISIYEKSMTSIMMIPTVDEASEYYMSRTKTAMDALARAADASLADATDYQSEIVSTNYVIQKIRELDAGQPRLAEAQAMVNKLETAINEISEQLFVLDKAYIKYKSQNYITFTYGSASFLQRLSLKKTLMESVAVMLGSAWLLHERQTQKGKAPQMKKFEILRYLKRFSLLIFLVSLAGAAAIYLYADGRQKYTASVIIRYTNDGISDGYTPDGSELDVNEIYSSTVISQAMDALGASGRLSTIRSNISVTPVISEDQQTINDALLQKGEEVTYFPDTYKVSLVVDGEQGAGYARNMLDAIIQSYCTYYTEKYVEQKLSLNPSSGLLDNGYDYYECIRILENDTNEMQDYLLSKREHYPNFRSSRTGYTYADLCDIYSDFKKYTIPALYAYVLNGPQVRDGTVLQEYLANTIETAKQNEQITTEQRDSLWSLTDQYVYKNADLLQNYFTDRGEVVSSDYILNNIELEGAGDKAQTTYDGLVLKLVSLEQQVASSQIDRQFQEEILQSFRNVDFGGTGEQHAKMESMINDYEAQLKSYYEIINTSSKELNLYISADYLKMISSVQVAAAINVKLYLMLALVLFFVIGCCGAILLGRISDAVDYLLYVDKKTGLPNREKLNVYITGMADRILPEDYTCFALQLDNLTEMSRRFGYHVGDGILKDFSGLLQLMGDTDGTVGYNGAGKFLAFFDECSTRKAEVMIRILQSQVDEYNKPQPGVPHPVQPPHGPPSRRRSSTMCATLCAAHRKRCP